MIVLLLLQCFPILGIVVKCNAIYCDQYRSKVFSLRVKDNSVLCVQCGRWIHGKFAGEKSVTLTFSRNVKGILVRQWSRKKSYGKTGSSKRSYISKLQGDCV